MKHINLPSTEEVEGALQNVANLVNAILLVSLGYFLLPAMIIGLAFAEALRVSDGIALFDAERATLMSLVVVAVYLILHTVRASLIFTEYGSMEKPQMSLRHGASNIWYFLGVGRNWQERHTTALHRLEKASRSVGSVIIVLGTLGSMQERLGAYTGAWYRAIADIVATASLVEFIAIVGGLVLTAALLRAIEWVIPYAYELRMTAKRDGSVPLNDYADYFKAAHANRKSRFEPGWLQSADNPPQSFLDATDQTLEEWRLKENGNFHLRKK